MMNKYVGIMLVVMVLTTGIALEMTTPVVTASTTITRDHTIQNRGSSCGYCHVPVDTETGLPYPELEEEI